MDKNKLLRLSISQLRNLDIKNKEDELLVQEVLDEKFQNEPMFDPNRVSFSSQDTDQMTPQKEAELQAKIDGPLIEVTASETIEIDPTTIDGTDKPFCEFCDSRGVRHKKECKTLLTKEKENV